jgi:hypothetical protein
MIIFITKIEKPIFEEKLTNFSNPGVFSDNHITLVVYQLAQKTGFAYSTFNKVTSIYFDGDSNHQIPGGKWTEEMFIHAKMRENTVAREPKSVRYTKFGKAFFILCFIIFLTMAFLAEKSISDRKKELKQEATLAIPPQQGDLYYGYFVERDPSAASAKMLWTWLRVVKIEGKTYFVSINKTKEEEQSSDDKPNSDFEEHTFETELITGTMPGFRTKDNSFDFLAKRKQ